MEIKNIIRDLVKQVNIEAISSKDMVEELTKLYQKVEALEGDLERVNKKASGLSLELDNANKTLNKFRSEYVLPAITLKEQTEKLEKEKFEFNLEKKYLIRENQIYREVLSAVVANKYSSESYFAGNGNSYNKSESLLKPSLPTT